MKNLYHSFLNNILDEVIVHVEQVFKTMGKFRFAELLNLQLFHAYKKNIFFFQWKHFQLWIHIKTYIWWIEVQVVISLYCRFCKASVKHWSSCKDNMGTWTKPSSSKSSWMTMSDSDHTCHICFLWEIIFTKAYK